MKNIAENVQITSEGIKNSLKKYKSLQAIAEYIWNGFDASASEVTLELKENDLENIEEIIIKDNGIGINKELLTEKFKPFYQSEKMYSPNYNLSQSTAHGKNGIGRLTFFTFANNAEWDTVYEKKKTKYSYNIKINSETLETYYPSQESETTSATGTTVVIYNVFDKNLSVKSVSNFLAKEFCWFLKLNEDRNFKISLNENPLNIDKLIIHK